MEDQKQTPKDSKEPKHPVVTAAQLQSAVMFAGQTESTFNSTRIHGIKMAWIKGEGLLVKKGKFEAMIPATNVKIAQFGADK